MRRALYPGSFDPVTNGHLDLVHRALALFDEVVIAVAVNAAKDPLFSLEERRALLEEVLGETARVRVTAFDGLLVDYAREIQACVLVRGLRAVSDFEYEFQLALMNRHLDDELETVFLMPSADYTYLSSRMVKEVARLGGNVRDFLPIPVLNALQTKLGR